MAFDSRTYRILIASPSDVEEEREIAVRVIQEWNDLHSYSTQTVLLPVRWETHTAPEYGTRPQEAINRTIVDDCDLLVAIFWTRVGTSTEVAESGTIEEISRVASAGKPVMLYFSKVGVHPDHIDIDQLTRLREFANATYARALIETYKSQLDFRDKFAKQLEMKIRDLRSLDKPGKDPGLDLTISGNSQGEESTSRSVTMPELEDEAATIEHEPDATADAVKRAIQAAVERQISVPVLLAIKNKGSSGVRNLYVEVNIKSSATEVEVLDARLSSVKWNLFTGLLSHESNFSRVAESDGRQLELPASDN